MERIKLLLMIGGSLILVGIVLRLAGFTGILPTTFFALGGLLKALYLIIGIRTGRFTIGPELILLPVGVALVLMGVYFKNSPDYGHLYVWFLVSGVVLKSAFLFLFFRRQRRQVVKE